ncbi:hypothetical protein pipiens_007307 [Culex pipiens pipiens]|uniref:Uncharacterized protein n=1 Tax=Culex pipiens pipiens TaxID=38569 RepID=A0ABD1DNU6_CULPP
MAGRCSRKKCRTCRLVDGTNGLTGYNQEKRSNQCECTYQRGDSSELVTWNSKEMSSGSVEVAFGGCHALRLSSPKGEEHVSVFDSATALTCTQACTDRRCFR